MATLLYIILWLVGGGCVSLLLHVRRVARHKQNLVNVFLAYLLLIMIFAHVYEYLYAADHSRFAFNTDLRLMRHQEVLLSRNSQLHKIEITLAAVDELLVHLSDMRAVIHVSPADKMFIRLQTTRYSFGLSFAPHWSRTPTGKLFKTARLSIADKHGTSLGEELVESMGPDLSLEKALPQADSDAVMKSYSPPPTSEQLSEMIMPLHIRLVGSLNQVKLDVARLTITKQGASNPNEEDWNYFDFLYFSTITQTTVGYGDILPKRTIVRACVVLQVLLGLSLLGVVITWVTTEKKS